MVEVRDTLVLVLCLKPWGGRGLFSTSRDRKKDLIIYKGYNVYPCELEEVLFQHPAVEQCAVVGRADMEVGEAPVAFVQLRLFTRSPYTLGNMKCFLKKNTVFTPYDSLNRFFRLGSNGIILELDIEAKQAFRKASGYSINKS